MNHLTDEQLSALLDDALAPPARATCEAHLGSCDACRARLAELSSLDAALKPALTHDPGEAYFATFAERVGARIAAGDASQAARTDRGRHSLRPLRTGRASSDGGSRTADPASETVIAAVSPR